MSGFALYSRGYRILHKPPKVSAPGGGGKRGKLVGKASSASFRRLRDWCVTHDIPGSDCWGITLTVPGFVLMDVAEFKRLHHSLCVYCNYHRIPCVWRVELQRRGQPHIHIVSFGTCDAVYGILMQWQNLLSKVGCLSLECVSADVSDFVVMPRAFIRGASHAFDLQHLTGDFRAWRYLVAHMSKAKQSQLGWAGRNWGVCNRDSFLLQKPFAFDVSDKAFWKVFRWLNRLYSGVPSNNKGKRLNKMIERQKTRKHYRRLEQGGPAVDATPSYRARHLPRRGDVVVVSNPETVTRMVAFSLGVSGDVFEISSCFSTN